MGRGSTFRRRDSKMRSKHLGYTDLQLSVIGLGSFAMGGSGWRFSWGPQEDEDSIRAIVRGVELGVNWIDTAPVYGFGHSSRMLRSAYQMGASAGGLNTRYKIDPLMGGTSIHQNFVTFVKEA